MIKPRPWKVIRLGDNGDPHESLYCQMRRKDPTIPVMNRRFLTARDRPTVEEVVHRRPFTAHTGTGTVQLGITSVAALGFVKPAPYEQICNLIEKEIGSLCPPKVGPYLFLQEPPNETVIIAMEPIKDSDGCCPRIFLIAHNESTNGSNGHHKHLFRIVSGHPKLLWDIKTKFVFVIDGKQPSIPSSNGNGK